VDIDAPAIDVDMAEWWVFKFAAGARIRITGAVDAATVTAAVAALADRWRR
jgi:hypothetical protein